MTGGARATVDSKRSSHDHVAEELTGAQFASELAYLASTVTVLLRRLAAGVTPVRLDEHLDNATRLAAQLEEGRAAVDTNAEDLRYRQLIPLRLWSSAIADDSELQSLPTLLQGAVEAIRTSTHDASDLLLQVELVERLKQRLEAQVTATLSSLGH